MKEFLQNSNNPMTGIGVIAFIIFLFGAVYYHIRWLKERGAYSYSVHKINRNNLMMWAGVSIIFAAMGYMLFSSLAR